MFIYRNGFEYLRYGYAAAVMLALTVLAVVIQWRLTRPYQPWYGR